MPHDRLIHEWTIDRLVADLEPVRPRKTWRDAALIAGLAVIELALVVGLVPPRADIGTAMTGPMFWWKLASCLGLAVAGCVALLAALSPETQRDPRVNRWMIGAATLAVLAGIVLTDFASLPEAARRTLDWRDGLACVAMVELFALPMLLMALIVARRAAPSLPRATAFAAGLASAGWGAVAFTWRCPHDDPMYVIIWYGLAVLIGALVAATVLPRWLRW